MPTLLTATFTATLISLAPPASKASDSIPIERFTLDNGLKVVLSEDHSAPIVTTYITYKVGAAQEQKGFTGFAHLFEHMMFNGSKHVPEGAYAWYIDGTGGVLNGNTESDRTNYFQTVPSNYLEGMLWLEADRMAALTITEEALANEKDVVKEEVRQQQENQPFVKTILLDWPSVAYSSWEYSHSIYGSMDDLSNAPKSAFEEFFARYYVPNNAALVIVGDFDPAQARKLIETYFGGIPRGPDNTWTYPAEAVQTQAVYQKVSDPLAPVPAALISWDVPQPRTKDRDALELLAAVLSEGDSSRLRKRLIDQDKLAIEVVMMTGFPIPTYGPGELLTLLIPANNVDVEAARKVLWEEIELVRSKGVSKAELDTARAKKKLAYVQSLGDTLFKAEQLATYETFFGGAQHFVDDYRRFDAITVKDLQRVAKDYLSVERSVTFDILPDAAAGMPALGGAR
ncbi:M16 family metallopeptidase [Nannocystaceae bacterium ST9]